MQSVGHRTFGEVLRAVSSHRDDIRVDAFWASEERSLLTKIGRKILETKLPVLAKANWDLRRARAEWATGWMSRKLAIKKLRSDSYDALHFHTQTAAFDSFRLMEKIKTFITIDMTAYQLAKEFNAGSKWTYYPNVSLERKVFLKASHIITFSEWARKSVIEDHHISPDRVTTITPGVRIQNFPTPSFEIRSRPRILFVGNDFIRKGGDDLLAVFNQNFSETAELHLVTNDKIEGLGPAVQVHSGVIAYTERWQELYQRSDIFVMVSRAEALGMVFQEAAASGLALIGTAVGGIPEMITPSMNGFLIAPGDRAALKKYLGSLIDNIELRQSMRKASRERALRDFDANANINRVLDLMSSHVRETPAVP